MIRLIRTGIVLLTIYIASAPGTPAPNAFAEDAKPTITIGAVLHLTGELAAVSSAFREGIELSIEQANSSADTGFSLRLILEDAQNKRERSSAAVKKLIYQDKVHAVILSDYFDVMVSRELFEKSHVPALVLWDSSPEIDAAGEYIFAIGPWTPSSAHTAAEFAHQSLKSRKAVIFTNTDSWSEAASQFFKEKFQSSGGEVLDTIRLGSDDVDYRSIISRAVSRKPDLFYTPIVTNLVAFYRQLREAKFPGQVISSDMIAEEHLNDSPKIFEGVYQTGLRTPTSPTFQAMKALYESRHKKTLTMPWFVAVGYDAVRLFLQSMQTSGTTPQKITDGLYRIANFPGASDVISINRAGSSPQHVVMYRIQQGKFVQVAE